MKVHITEAEKNVEYRVLEREVVSDETLTGMFYAFKDGVWSKGYPKAALMFPQDLAQMEANFNVYIETELHQDRSHWPTSFIKFGLNNSPSGLPGDIGL